MSLEAKVKPILLNRRPCLVWTTTRRRWGALMALSALSAVVCWTAGCGEKETAAAAPPDVEIVSVEQKDVPIVRTFVGTLTGLVNAQIRAQVSGYLIKQLYVNGAYVKKGAPLFQLDPRTFQAAVDQAGGNLAQARG